MAASTKTQVGGPGRVGPCVFTSTSNPTVDNDAVDGVHVGDQWINTSNHRLYWCEDNTTGNAVWKFAAGS